MNAEQGKNYHEAIIELMCNADEFIFCREKEKGENKHLAFEIILSISLLINPNKQPHPNHIKNNMHITHILLIDIEVSQPIEEAIDVQARSRVLNWARLTY